MCCIQEIILSLDVWDYSAFHFAMITFDEGAVYGDEQCYLVAINNDTVVEDNEVFFVTLTSSEPAFLMSSLTRATVTIHRDPADCK